MDENYLHATCRLCLMQQTTFVRSPTLDSILKMHFAFEFKDRVIEDQVCMNCWTEVERFHDFYLYLENLHTFARNLYGLNDSNVNTNADLGRANASSVNDIPSSSSQNENPYQRAEEEFWDSSSAGSTEFVQETIENNEPIPNEPMENSTDEQGREISPSQRKYMFRIETSSDESLNMMPLDYNKVHAHFRMACEFCRNNPFENFEEAAVHYNFIHDRRGFVKCCGLVFYNEEEMSDHILYHYDSSSYSCFRCNRVFLRNEHLRAHRQTEECRSRKKKMMENHETFQKLKCETSLNSSKNDVNVLINTDCRPKDILCVYCGKVFKSLRLHELHDCSRSRLLNAKGSLDSEICAFCKIGLKDKSALVEHLELHWDMEHNPIHQKDSTARKLMENKLMFRRSDF